MLDSWWGPFTVDRFASDLNAQLPRFNSRWWCPGTSGVNCFLQDWKGENNWVNPDFSLIRETILHMKICEAKGCLILPFWPSRPWWSMLFVGEDKFAPGVLHVYHFPRKERLFVQAAGGSVMLRDTAPFHCIAVHVDFSLKSSHRGGDERSEF